MMVEDIAMDMERIESKIIEMMEVEDQTDGRTGVWLEDKDGDQVMPEVGIKDTMDIMEDMGTDIGSALFCNHKHYSILLLD
jgi:hypothetical protein